MLYGDFVVLNLAPFVEPHEPESGTGVFLKACRYDGTVSTVSTRALMVLYAIFSSFAQFGIRPHRRASSVRFAGFGMKLNRENILCWRDVVTDRRVELPRDRDMILRSDFFFGCCSSLPSANCSDRSSGARARFFGS
jgi:hypothetical protein